jgi:integrase
MITLARARELAADRLFEVRQGGDPSREKREAREAENDTFGALCGAYIERHARPRKRSWKRDRSMLRNQTPGSWKHRPAPEISRREIRRLIEEKGERHPIQANRLRALLHKVFAFALERELVEFNPVDGTPRPGVERSRDRVLTPEEIREFWTATEAMDTPMRAWWRLRLVTAQRAAEVNSMRWEDLDLDGRVWTVPEGVVKNKLSHRVPLSDLAMEIVRELQVVRGEPYVLAGARGKRQQGEAAKTIPVNNFRGHDLRRTAASLMASAGVPRLHIGKVLNHAEQGVTAVYDRHGYDEEKRVALETWERKLLSILEPGEGAEVVPITAGGRR